MKTIGYGYLLSFFASTLIFIAVGTVSYLSLDSDQRAGSKAAVSYGILNTIKELGHDSKDISLSRYGFILSGDKLFLEPYSIAGKEITLKLKRLDSLTQNEPEQNRNVYLLSGLITLKSSLMEISLSQFSENKKYNRGQNLITLVNGIIDLNIDRLSSRIEKNQLVFLNNEIDSEYDAENNTRAFIIAGNLIALITILISFIVARKKNLQKQKEAEYRAAGERDLKNKQIELSSLMDILPVGVYYIDNFQHCTYVNDTWCEITGFDASEVYGTTLENILHPDDRQRTYDSFLKSAERGRNFHDEYRYVCRNGDIKYMVGHAAAKVDADGKIIGYIGTVMDITSQHIYREGLVKYNTLFESISESITDAIFVKDVTGRYEYINSAGAEMIGKEAAEIIGKKDSDLYPPETALENSERDTAVYNCKCNINYEVTSSLPGGLVRTYLSTRGLIYSSQNKPAGLFGVLRDITAIKEKENRIKKSLTEKETLLRETHHRVKNNLQVVASLLNMQSGYIKDEESKHFFQDSQNRVRTIATLHEKLYGSEKFTHVQLKKYIEQLIGILVTSFGINSDLIKISQDIEEIEIETKYSVPIGLVVNEIITNSFKYAFPDGSSGKIFIKVYKSGEELLMEIGDNGKGLNETLDIASLKSLGLQLIFTLIEGQLGGKVSFLPKSSGLVFNITIPMKMPVFNES